MKTREIISGTVAGLFAGSFRPGEKSRKARRLCWAAGILLGLAGASSAQANLLQNPSFETSGTTPQLFANWTMGTTGGYVTAVTGSAALDGSRSAALQGVSSETTNSVISQDVTSGAPTTTFTLSFQMAMADPGYSVGGGVGRTGDVFFSTAGGGNSGNQLNFRIEDTGDGSGYGTVGLYDSTNALVNAELTDDVVFSSNLASNPQINTFTITGNIPQGSESDAGGTYTVSVTNSKGTFTSAPVAYWQFVNSTPIAALSYVTFDNGANADSNNGNFVVDNADLENTIVTPEPASMGLFAGIVGLGLLKRRRSARRTAAC